MKDGLTVAMTIMTFRFDHILVIYGSRSHFVMQTQKTPERNRWKRQTSFEVWEKKCF